MILGGWEAGMQLKPLRQLNLTTPDKQAPRLTGQAEAQRAQRFIFFVSRETTANEKHHAEI
jgi:hypothetical protein